MRKHYGAIEAGGTKFVCLVGSGPDDIVAETQFATREPGPTIDQAVAFFRDVASTGSKLEAIGIALFGPIELRKTSAKYGFVTKTPKPGWSDVNLVAPIGKALGVPVGFDTDVNGAALGEWRWGAARGLITFVYVTAGTGIGGGGIVGGRPAHGLVHPEMGHVSVPRQPGDDFSGICPFHGDCLEGMASGPAIEKRWGRPAEELTGSDLRQAVALEAAYLAAGLRNIVYTLAPERIVLGGGLSELPRLFPALREALENDLAGYPGLIEHESPDFVIPPALGTRAGALGALILAERAVDAEAGYGQVGISGSKSSGPPR